MRPGSSGTARSAGFTLIELMIVVVIIGVLAAIAIPNLIHMQDRAKESEVKQNCRTVALVAEDYAVIHDAEYPALLPDIQPMLPGGVLLRNPFTSVASEPIIGATPNEGGVAYEPAISNGVAVGYQLRGGGRDDFVVLTLSSGM